MKFVLTVVWKSFKVTPGFLMKNCIIVGKISCVNLCPLLKSWFSLCLGVFSPNVGHPGQQYYFNSAGKFMASNTVSLV